MRCPNCNADMNDELQECDACGYLPHNESATPEALSMHSAVPDKPIPFVSKGMALSLLVTFALGVWVGALLFGRETYPLTSPAGPTQTQSRVATFDSQINAFILQINNLLHLDIISWFRQSDGSVVFEMARPTEEAPTLWEVLTPEERQQVFGYLSAAYTTQVWQAGGVKEMSEGRFPILILTYSKSNQPLAVRDDSGKIYIYPSPYESR